MFRERIRQNYQRLSKSQQRIADFLMTSYREVAFMTASQLAALLNVDVATITRFAQRLHYQGYPELLDDVRSSLQQEISAGFRPNKGPNTLGQLFTQAIEVQRENIERTLANISLEDAEKAITAIAQARTVYVTAIFTLAPLAEKFVINLDLLGISSVLVTGEGIRMALSGRSIGSEDVMIGLGFSGYAMEPAAIMQAARDCGARTIAITGSDLSPVARVADIVLTCVATTPLHTPSEVTLYTVLDAIFYALAVQRLDIMRANLDIFSQFHQRFVRHLKPATGSVEEILTNVY